MQIASGAGAGAGQAAAGTADTRMRLIGAGLDIFGRAGFEAASTRAIAAAAGANIAAIKYHFGSKHGLYLAVARHIAERVAAAMGGPAGDAAEMLSAGPPDREAAKAMLMRLVAGAVRLLVIDPQAERWARFILREQFEPTEAFDIMYATFMGRMHVIVARLVAVLLGLDPDSREAKLEAFALMGQVLVFRIARAAVLKRLDWHNIGSSEGELIVAQLARSIERLSPVGEECR